MTQITLLFTLFISILIFACLLALSRSMLAPMWLLASLLVFSLPLEYLQWYFYYHLHPMLFYIESHYHLLIQVTGKLGVNVCTQVGYLCHSQFSVAIRQDHFLFILSIYF
mmetsp:Transcript_36404/g.87822  ORF Transcript_36404/g.87822 Transcript_36404/m.87822 type:complete len:110 (+) Transcript_36404:2432-2761(+)